MLTLLMVFCASASVVAAEARPDQPIDLQAEAKSIQALGIPGVVIFTRQGEDRQTATAGRANIEQPAPLTGDEVWRVASVTKLITGIVIQTLNDMKLISLQDPVSKYLPKIVPQARRITIRQLLNHTSGIPDYLSAKTNPINVSAKELKRSLVRKRTNRQLIADANRLPREFLPGRRHSYSNTNYLLLEMIIEKVTRAPFRELLRDEMIQPLGLERTGFPDAEGRMPFPHLHGYVSSDSPLGPFTDRSRLVDVTYHDYFRGGDGGLYSNIKDLAKMIDALVTGRMISRTRLLAMIKDLKQDHDGVYRYGLAITVFPTKCGRPVYGHEGRDLGIYTTVMTTLDGRQQMILVANSSQEDVPELAQAMEKLRDRVFCD